MIRKAFVMQLHPGQEEEYRRRHAEIWPELERTLQDADVRAYSIFLHPQTLQLFAYVEIVSEESGRQIAEDGGLPPLVGVHAGLMETNADPVLRAIPLEEVFRMDRPGFRSKNVSFCRDRF